MADIPSYKANFLHAALDGRALRLGSFELKSGRTSPYFFNAGDFYRADLLSALAVAYANTIHESFSSSATDLPFDVIFGPAYKGIPLATATTFALAQLDDRYKKLEYSFDRKEAKDHGEGGSIVGAPLKGRRVLIIDDVVSAGTAKREAIGKIQAEGGTVVGIVVALDRQETLPNSTGSAIGLLRKEYNIPIVAVLKLDDIVKGLKESGVATEEDLKRIEEYRAKYGASD
ncbi:putative Orotate phosphoribosyltransferase [Seiridium cardinale]|uniref:Orotate phosphoribosyltransferase n=1 Tax=Seiridium cardinale TaxID=138064 RepID=A0ABR2XBZ6_9PEZI